MAPQDELSQPDRPSAPGQGTDLLGTLLSLMPDAAIMVDGNGTIVAVNTRTESFFGYPASELEGKSVEMLVPERYRHAHRRQRAAYVLSPHARPMGAGLDLYARRRDGTEFPVDISLAPISGARGPLVVAAVRDITERKASHSAEAQLAAIVQSSADAIFSITRHGVITSWNPAAEAMFGYPRASAVGRHISQFFPDDPVFEALLDAARSGRSAPSHDTRWQTAKGSPVDVAISTSLLGPSDQAGYSVLVRDITIRKAAEAQLRRQALWQQATAEIRLSFLSDAPARVSLDLVCKWAVELSQARAAAVLIGVGDRLTTEGWSGDPSALRALEAPAPAGRAPATHIEDGLETRTVALPFQAGSPLPLRNGVLAVAWPRPAPRQEDEQQVLTALATQAVLALELASIRAERDRLLISADRERIARDLHDLVIQRLFGAGLRLQGALGLIDSDSAAERVASTIDDLDTTIKEIREAIFALEAPPGMGLRARLAAVVEEATEALGFKPGFSFQARDNKELPVQVQLEAAAVLREALSNAARHAQASRVEVTVSVDDELGVEVVDNGIGITRPGHLSGIANARARAQLLRGQLEVAPSPGGGTMLEWRVPVPAEPPA
ncbi:MAG: PAS domain-containing sensor histidine kinase [Acidimicrobiales bacterium]